MSKVFDGLRAFIIPIKLSDYEVGHYHHLIDKHGGSVSQNQKESTLILTILKSFARISRNIKNHQIPVVDIQWIKDCDKAKALLPTESYLIIEGSQDNAHLQPVEKSQSAEILNRKFSDVPPEDLLYNDEEIPGYDSDSDEEKDIDIAPKFINTKYECLRPTPNVPIHNKKLISLLILLERKRQLDSENKRSLSYRHAISALKAYPREIRSSKEAAKIIGVGKKMADKIQSFLKTGTIEEAESLRSDEQFRTLSLFNQVFGVGAITAKIWWNLGYRTLQEVLDRAKITPSVRLGIELLPDFDQKMSRQDVEEIIEIIKKELKDLDSNVFVTPVGGYRRGKTKNGDLDLLISVHCGSASGVLDKLTEHLIGKGYLKHKLWHSSEVKAKKQISSSEKSSGRKQVFDNFEKCFCAFLQPSKGILRQVDLITVPPAEMAMAILGWTGSRQFERSIRDYAKKEKNMSVNSQSIHVESRGVTKRLVVNSEKEAFQIIGVPYLEPEFRNC